MPRGHGAAIFLVICLGATLLSYTACVSGLATGEERALEEILSGFPSLLQINPMGQYDDSDNDWGGSWLKPVAQICANGDGWDVHGIHCAGGHIDAIRLSLSWGPKLPGRPVPDFSGLLWLTNISTTPTTFDLYEDVATANAILIEILALPTLRSVQIGSWPDPPSFPVSAFQAANLTHLSLMQTTLPSISFASMHFLEEVTTTRLNPADFQTQFTASAATLRTLTVYGNVLSTTGIADLVALQNLELSGAGNTTFSIPTSLKALTIRSWTSPTLDIGDGSSNLEYLSLSSAAAITSIEFFPSTLKHLWLQLGTTVAWNYFPTPCKLEHFEMWRAGVVPAAAEFASCPSLTKFRLVSPVLGAINLLTSSTMNIPTLQELAIESVSSWPDATGMAAAHVWLCSAPSTLRRLSLRGTAFKTLPSCVSNLFNLESLDMTIDTGATTFDSFLLANFTSSLKELHISLDVMVSQDENFWLPMSNQFPGLKKLEVSRTTISPVSQFPNDALNQLTSLERLVLRDLGLVGPLSDDFFKKHEKLSYCDLSYNQLNTTIPSSGWSSLTYLDLSQNQFSAWATVDTPGAPLLKKLLLYNNAALSSIPTDDIFLEMTELRELHLYGNVALATLPTFWANGDHKLQQLLMHHCALSGPLPRSIRTPHLRYLELSNNQLCGPLPEIDGPTSLISFSLWENRLTGTIPTSWAQYLTVRYLYLNNNLLSGVLPERFLTGFSNRLLLDASLNNNYFTGSMPNMTQFENLLQLNLNGENMTLEFCSAASPLPIGLPGCSLEFDPSICACSALYPSCIGNAQTVSSFCGSLAPESFNEPSVPFPPRNAVVPPSYYCEAPPMSPNAHSCPLPQPGPSFQCIGTAWVSPISVTQPSLTVPGSTIIIQGNLTLTDGITFNGINSQVIVNGCIILGNGNQVVVELTKEELEQLEKEGKVSKTLLSVNSACTGSSDLSATVVSATKPEGAKKCQKLTVENSGSSPTTLVVAFSLDSSSCNTKWIILGSVLGGVILLAVTGAILLVTFNSKARECVRPFAKKNTLSN